MATEKRSEAGRKGWQTRRSRAAFRERMRERERIDRRARRERRDREHDERVLEDRRRVRRGGEPWGWAAYLTSEEQRLERNRIARERRRERYVRAVAEHNQRIEQELEERQNHPAETESVREIPVEPCAPLPRRIIR